MNSEDDLFAREAEADRERYLRAGWEPAGGGCWFRAGEVLTEDQLRLRLERGEREGRGDE